MNIPESTESYYNNRAEYIIYPTEEAIYNNTGYNDVCISYTYQIDFAPPNCLAVSGKRVYRVNSIADVKTMFPEMNEEAEVVLVIDNKTPVNDKNTMIELNALRDDGECVFEDEYCSLYRLGHKYL